MLSKIGLKTVGVLCALLLFTQGYAQTSSSIYSALGIGDFNSGGLTHNQGMGGMGISFATGWHANVVNPALTTRNTIFNFQAALNYKRINVNNGTESSLVDGGGLSYLAISLPIKSGKFTSGMGLGQISSINYRLQVETPVANSELKASNFISKQSTVSVSAGGEASIHATDFVDAKVKAGGEIYIYGSPKQINQKTVIGGTIKEMN